MSHLWGLPWTLMSKVRPIGETFTENSINAIFERVLGNRQHGKAL